MNEQNFKNHQQISSIFMTSVESSSLISSKHWYKLSVINIWKKAAVFPLGIEYVSQCQWNEIRNGVYLVSVSSVNTQINIV